MLRGEDSAGAIEADIVAAVDEVRERVQSIVYAPLPVPCCFELEQMPGAAPCLLNVAARVPPSVFRSLGGVLRTMCTQARAGGWRHAIDASAGPLFCVCCGRVRAFHGVCACAPWPLQTSSLRMLVAHAAGANMVYGLCVCIVTLADQLVAHAMAHAACLSVRACPSHAGVSTCRWKRSRAFLCTSR